MTTTLNNEELKWLAQPHLNVVQISTQGNYQKMISQLLQSPSLLLSLALAVGASQVLAPRKSQAAISVAAYFLSASFLNVMYINGIDAMTFLAAFCVCMLACMLICVMTLHIGMKEAIALCVYLLIITETSMLMLDFEIYPYAQTWIYTHDPLIQAAADLILLAIGAISAPGINSTFLRRRNPRGDSNNLED